MNKRLLLLFVVLVMLWTKSSAQFTLSENFKGSNAPGIKLGNDAVLTSGNADAVNQGWLRLTNDVGDQRGYAFIDKSFPSTLGVLVDFEYKTWHNASEGADGIVVFLFDGNITQANFRTGGTGAGLGYAPRGDQSLSGLKGAYLGIGLDEYGNFSSNFGAGATGTTYTESTPSSGLSLGRYPNSITLRGSESDKYRLLAMKTLPISDGNTVQYTAGGTLTRPTDGTFYRRVQIEIKPNTNGRYDIIVRWATAPGGAFTQLFTYSLVDQGGVSYAPPSTLKLGFTSATGGSYNKHEIRNVQVTTPGNLRVNKRADKDFLRTVSTGNANKVSYTIDVVNDTQSAVTNVQFKDRLTDGAGNLVPKSTFLIDATNGVTFTGFSPGTSIPQPTSNEITGSLNMAANSTGKITVSGTVLAVPVGNALNNTANIVPTDITDIDIDNNTSVVSTPVLAENVDLTIQKTVSNPCLTTSGDSYSAVVSNVGTLPTTSPNKIVVTKTYPSSYVFTPGTDTGWSRSAAVLASGNYTITYTYTANGGVLNSGASTSPIQYTLKAPAATSTYADIISVKYINTNSENIELTANQNNNTSSNTLATVSGKPVVSSPVTYCLGAGAAPLTATASNGNTLLWYRAIGGVSSVNAPVPLTNTAGNTSYYVRQTNGSCESDYSEIIVTVQAAVSAGTINANQTICNGSVPAALTSTAAGSGGTSGATAAYRWEKSVDNGATWIAIPGATAVSYSSPALTATTQFRRVFMATLNGVACESSSAPVIITVQNTPGAGSIGPNQTICTGTLAGAISSVSSGDGTGSGTLSYRWESSVNGSLWNIISGATQASYTTTAALSVTTQFRRTTISTQNSIVCSSVPTNIVTVTVTPNPTVANAGADIEQFNSGVFTLQANAPAVGTGTWSVSTGSATIADPLNRNTTVTITENTNATLRWTITNGPCAASFDDVKITYTKRANLQISKTVDKTNPVVGDNVTFTLTAKNNGPSDASGVKVTDALKAGYSFVSSSSSNYNSSNGEWLIGTLESGLSQTLSIIAKVNPNALTADYGNFAAITATETDPDLSNNSVNLNTVVPIPSVDIEVNKTATPKPAVAGQALSYTITLKNNGPSTIKTTDVFILTENFPAGYIPGSFTPSSGTFNAINGNWSGLSLAAGQQATLTIAGSVAATANGTLSNTVSVAVPAGISDPNINNNSKTDNTLINRQVDLGITKTSSPKPVIAGNSLTYNITLSNNGPSSLLPTDQVKITEDFPASFTALTFSSSVGTFDKNTGNWTGLSLAQGQTATLTIVGSVAPGAVGTLSNTASVAAPAGTTDTNTANNTATETTAVNRQIDFEITKTSSLKPAIAGESLSYTITVSNKGVSAMSSGDVLKVTDVIPAGFAASAYNASSGSYDALTGNWNGLSLASGQSASLTISGKVAASATATLVNKAILSVPAGITDPISNNNESTDNTPIVAKPVLAITKSGASGLTAGSSVSYNLKVVNTGSSDALNAAINDAVPQGVENVSWQATANGAANIVSGASGSGNAVAVRANIPAGNQNNYIIVEINGTLNPAASGSVNNTASVNPAEAQGTGGNSSINANVTSSSGIVISKAGASSAAAGDALTYRIEVGNNGPSNATAVQITDLVPAGLTAVSWTSQVQGGATVTSGASGTGNTINLTANVPAGVQHKIILNVTGTVRPDYTGTISNTATATPQEAGSTPVSAQAVTNINSKPVFTIVKTGPASVIAGNNIAYTILVRNTGPSNSTGTLITDNIPLGITGVAWTSSVTDGVASISSGASGTGNALSLKGNFNANSTIQINVTGRVGSGTLGNLINSATVSPAEAGVVPVISNQVNTSVSTKSGLTIIKSGPSSVVSGTSITYTIEVGNTGPSDALNANVADLIPAEILNPSWTTVVLGGANIVSGGSGSGHSLQTVVNIPAGTANKATITITGQVNPAYNGSVTNTANVTASEAGSPSPQSSVSTTINRTPVVSIIKNAPSSVISGANLTYSIEVINNSTADAQNLEIKDLVSSEISDVSWTATLSGAASLNGPVSGTGNNIILSGNIPAGAANKITLNIIGKVSAAYSGVISNTATATPSESGTSSKTSSVSTAVQKMPVLAIEKTGPSNISAGQSISYTLKIKNNATANADLATITDNIPTAIENVSWTANATGSASISGPASGTGNALSLVANLPGGAGHEIFVTIVGTVNPSATADLINSATVTPAETGAVAKTSNTITTQVAKTPLVSIIKTGPASAKAGETVSYIIEAVNAGPSNADNLLIADLVPAVLTNVSWSAVASGTSSVVNASGTGNVNLTGNLNVGNANKIQITLKGTIPATQLNTTISNTATATPVETGLSVNSNAVSTVISNKSNISVVKSAPIVISSGELVNYTLLVKNTGPSNALNASITDLVPTDIQNVSWTAVASGTATVGLGASGTGNAVNIKGDLPVGDANTILVQISGKLNPAFTGSSLSNTASVTPSESGNPVVNSNTAITTVNRQADLRISKTGPSNLFAGEQATYTITVENQGPGDVVAATIADALPSSIINASWSVATLGSATTNVSSGTGSLNLSADLSAGGVDKVIITLTGTVDPSFTGPSLTNTATATPPAGVTDPTPASASVVTTIARKANVRIVKSAPANAKAGEGLEYILKITNQGPSTATGTTIVDNFPPGFNAGSVSWRATATPGSTLNGGSALVNGTGNVNLTADIAPNTGVIEVRIQSTLSPALVNGAIITNTATANVSSGITDPELSNNSSSFNTIIDNDPNFTLAKSGPANANVGDQITYTISVKNSGSGDINDAFIVDNVPDDVQVTSWTASINGGAVIKSGGAGTGNNVFTVADIPAGANSILITVNGIIKKTASSSFTNKAEATSGDVKESSVTTSVNRSTDIAVIKAGPQRVAAGEDMTYTVNVYNNGSVDIDDILLSDNVNPALTQVSWSAVATGAASITTSSSGFGNAVTLSANIAGGQGNFITLTINGKLPSNAVLGPLNNTASITLPAGVTDYNPANNSSSVSTDVISTPTLVVQKTGPSTAAAGDGITYKIKVSNTGPSDATSVSIADVLPAEITAAQWTASTDGSLASISGPTSGTGNVGLNASLPAGGYIVVDVKGTINADFSGTIKNTATAKIGSNPAVSSPEVSTLVNKVTNLTILKSAPTVLSAGQPIVYTIEVGNNGPSNASAAELSDIIPNSILSPSWSTSVSGGAVVTANASGSGNALLISANIPSGGKIFVTINGILASSVTGNVSNTATITPSEPGNLPVVSIPAVTAVKQTPNLLLTKSAPTVSSGGSSITYALKLSNSGPSDAIATILSDVVPGNVQNVSWTSNVTNGAVITSGNTGTGNNVSLTADIPAKGYIDVLITGTINPLFKNTLVNTATAAPAEPGIQSTQSTVSTAVTPVVDLIISKSGPTNVSAGASINYQIVVKNNGPSTAINAMIADIVPVEITGVQWTATAEGSAAILSSRQGSGNNISINADLPSSSTDRIVIDINGTVSPAFNGNISNTASVTPTETGTAINSVPVVTAVSRQPVIKITKGGPAIIRSGNKISYLIKVVNEGTGDALNLSISDAAPVALTNVSWRTENIGLATASLVSGTGDVNIAADIPAGTANAINIYVTGEIPAAFDGTILNSVTAQPAESGAVASTSSVSTTVYRSSMSLVKQALNAVSKAGDVIAYELNVNNTGTSALSDLVIEDAGADAGSISPATIASLAAGASVKVTAKHTITQRDVDQGSFANSATVLAKAPDASQVSDISGNTATDDSPTVVQITPLPGVTLVKNVVGNLPNQAGQSLNYNLTVKNTGNVTLNNLVVSDANAVVSGSPIALLAPGASVVITASHLMSQSDIDAGSYSNSALVTASPAIGSNISDQSGTDETNDLPTVSAIAANGSMSLTKVANHTAAKAGDVIDYTIVVKNTGNLTLSNVIVSDQGADSGSILPASIAVLAPNATATFTAKHTVTQNNVDQGMYSNQASVNASDSKGTLVSNTKSDDPSTPAIDDATVSKIISAPSMHLTKVADNTGAKAGEIINYTIVVSNTGNVTLSNVVVNDPGADLGSVVPASISSIAPGASAKVIAKHTLNQADVDQGSYSNQATVTAAAPNGIPLASVKSDNPNTPAIDDATVSLIAASPAITLVKTGQLSSDGNRIAYTFTIKNTGNQTLSAVNIIDSKIGFTKTLTAPILPGSTFIETAVYTLTQVDKDAGNFSNSASVSAQEPKGQIVTDISGTGETNNSPTVIIIPAKGAISMVKTAAFSGNQVTYTFTIKNTGNVILNALEISDAKLGVLNRPVAVSGGLLPGAVITLSENYVLTQADKDLGSVSNTATIKAKSPTSALVQDVSGTEEANDAPTIINIPGSPKASDDQAQTKANTPVVINVLGNDDSGNSTFNLSSIEFTTPPQHGTVKVNSDGTVTYTPNPGYTGEDRFSYRVKDAYGYYSNIAQVNLSANFFEIRVPNLFTPNGDGINDVFEIRGLNQYGENELTIINRWGNEVYKGHNYQNTWNGDGLNEGTYFYVLRVKRIGSNSFETLKGYVTLIRAFKK